MKNLKQYLPLAAIAAGVIALRSSKSVSGVGAVNNNRDMAMRRLFFVHIKSYFKEDGFDMTRTTAFLSEEGAYEYMNKVVDDCISDGWKVESRKPKYVCLTYEYGYINKMEIEFDSGYLYK